MAQPIWITPEGSIGSYTNGTAVSFTLLATAVAPATSIRYSLVSGSLPTVLALNSGNGLISGVSTLVSLPTTNEFIVRATDNQGNTTDQSFSITILSTQPVWVTDAGSLGTIPEGVFYQVPLLAYDPADPEEGIVYYVLLAGQLPPGIQCGRTGLISGVPQAIASLQGVPSPVNRNVTSTFAVRAYTEKIVNGREVIDRLRDRTFSLTVTGEDPPQFVTPAGNVGTFYDGTPIDPIQILTTDSDPGDTTIISIAVGSLPPGLSISATGLITGYIIPLSVINDPGGFDRSGQNFDMFPFDFIKASPNTNFQFTLEVNDGKKSDLRTYEIFVYSRTTLQASTTDITADDTFVDASQTPTYLPFLVNAEPSDLGRVRAGNFWAYQFQGLNFGEYIIEYLEYPGAGLQLPPGTFLDPFTGWLYGYLPDLGAIEITYDFAIYLIDTNNAQIKSDPYYFTITLVGQVETEVIWLTDSDLGDIINGSTSLLRVRAENVGGRVLQYRLRQGAIPPTDYVPGVYNKLPQGLALLSEGDIAGRVSFNTFALDLGTTTFDTLLRTNLITTPQETTFDTQYTFTVNAYSLDGLISVYKTFTVKVLREYNEPYENLYIKAMPPFSARALISSLVENSDVFPADVVFRPQDPNFGVARSVIYNHCFGLTSSTYETYISSLVENHYWKNLILGEIKTAQAIDPVTGTVIYEVVYSAIQDNLVNNFGISVSKQVTLPYPINEGDSTEISVVYPNSLDNMRNQVIDVVGQISNLLPLWMLSKQKDGRVLGFTPAWVISYCNPGTSGQVAYNIRTQFGQQLNLVDFEVDRYELDRLLSINWDPIADSSSGAWVPAAAETTFDLVLHYEVDAFANAGTGYNIGDRILIAGSDLGGTDDLNSVTITVQDTNSTTGAITIVNLVGIAPAFSDGDTFTNISGTNITGSGIGAEFDFIVGSGDPTTFDQSSMRFEAPVDIYTNTDAFDKYLVFPRRNILV